MTLLNTPLRMNGIVLAELFAAQGLRAPTAEEVYAAYQFATVAQAVKNPAKNFGLPLVISAAAKQALTDHLKLFPDAPVTNTFTPEEQERFDSVKTVMKARIDQFMSRKEIEAAEDTPKADPQALGQV